MTAARRAGVAVLLVLVAGGALLAALPHLGIVRLAGVGLRWWYGALAAPALAALVTALVMLRAPAPMPAIAVWTGPALLTALAARVFAGDAGAALLPLVACLAPLAALLAAPWTPPPRDVPARALAGLAVALVLWANVLVLADVARVLGGERWHGVAVAVALAAAPALASVGAAARRAALALGIGAIALPLVVVAAPPALAPWAAWAKLAERAALVFDARSPWVTEGERLLEPTTLVFSEPHRVTAMSAGTYRVVEREGDRVVARDWRLAGGDSLELRPGDALDLGPGARVRFEAGKRVPGVAASGVAWADRQEPGPLAGLVAFLGVAITLAGGAAALLAPGRADAPAGGRLAALAVPGVVLAVVLAAVCWGVYAAFAGPDLALGAPAVAPLARLGRAQLGPPWDRVLAATAVTGLAALFVATADALRGRLTALAGGGATAPLAWGGAVAAAAALALASADPWRALTLACGFAAAVGPAPAMAGGGAAARALGAGVGGAAFAALALDAGHVAAWAPGLAAWPALGAAPLAWAAARVAGGTAGEVAPGRRG